PRLRSLVSGVKTPPTFVEPFPKNSSGSNRSGSAAADRGHCWPPHGVANFDRPTTIARPRPLRLDQCVDRGALYIVHASARKRAQRSNSYLTLVGIGSPQC